MGEHWFDPGSSDEEEELKLREAGEKKKAQSPWEFSAYSESVIDEHDRKGTTSVDTKITRLLQERPVFLPDLDDEEAEEDGGDADEEGKRCGLIIEQDHDDGEIKRKSRKKDKASLQKYEKGNEQGKSNFFASSEGASFSANSFLQLNLSRPLLRACEALGYRTPTPIQAACIPLALTGRDICGSAITGSGKTAAFTLPVLERLLFRPKRVHAIRVLILAPTRELAAQVHSMIEKLAQFTDIRCCLVLGGLSTKAQEVALRSLPDVVVATPGRIIDHLRNSLSVGLDDLAVLILDEADRLLEFGFSGEIQELIRLCPKRRQTMLFSATMTDEVDELVKLSLTKPVRLEADPLTKRPITLTEEVVRIRRMREVNQEAVLMALCSKTFTHKIRLCPKRRQTMLFSATMTDEVDELVKLSLTKPVRLEADPLTKRPITLTEEVVRIRRMREVNQEAVLMALCSKTFTHKVIIFSGTKLNAHRLKIIFGLAGFKAAELHGNLTQVQRLDALELFRKQEVDFLIATDVAARGLDIVGVQTVINFACPRDITSYVHRVGRTARAGREGHAITFVTDNDRSLLKAIAKRAGSQLRSRIVAEKSILEWSQTIEKMEEQISAILQEEREERALRKAEMEAIKAENMIAHKDEIFSRPPKTWFVTEKEKKLIADAAKKKSLPSQNENENENGKLMSANQAEELKMKEKRRREHERNLPRKKRRRLEAARETLEDNSDQENGNCNREKPGQSLVKLGYKRAKSLKASTKRGQAVKGNRKLIQMSRNRTSSNYSRKEEMQELFQNDMNEMKQARNSKKGTSIGGRKKSKSSFKSKSRFKRRK